MSKISQMDLSNIKLVAVDMDGTLLNANHELSDEFYPLFDQMKARGILFAVASGRQYYNLLNRFKPISDDVIFIGDNGSYVAYRNEEILVQSMEPAIVKELLTEAASIPTCYPILCGKDRAYVQHTLPRFIENVEMYYDKWALVDDLLKVHDDEFLKISLCDFGGSERNSYPVFKPQEDRLQVKISGTIWLDLSHQLANKGRAVEMIQKRFDITADETMAFGDYLNDLEMLQQASYSFAMANAHPDIKRAARFKALSNEENGVLKVIEQMLATMDQQKPVMP